MLKKILVLCLVVVSVGLFGGVFDFDFVFTFWMDVKLYELKRA